MAKYLFVFLLMTTLTACSSDRAPMLTLFGAYFPSWILCFIISIIMTILLRVLLIAVKLDELIAYKFIFYVSIMFILAFVFSFLFFQ